MTTECPTCRRPVKIPGDTEPMGHYPFCTERCKLVDLGRWLDGKYQVPVVEPDEGDIPEEPIDPTPRPKRL